VNTKLANYRQGLSFRFCSLRRVGFLSVANPLDCGGLTAGLSSKYLALCLR